MVGWESCWTWLLPGALSCLCYAWQESVDIREGQVQRNKYGRRLSKNFEMMVSRSLDAHEMHASRCKVVCQRTYQIFERSSGLQGSVAKSVVKLLKDVALYDYLRLCHQDTWYDANQKLDQGSIDNAMQCLQRLSSCSEAPKTTMIA